eukprot:m.428156 g.428156  ORF g.428156 m.428156 type:complete len:500 (-) comp67507_c0_seq1:272-1771(-)
MKNPGTLALRAVIAFGILLLVVNVDRGSCRCQITPDANGHVAISRQTDWEGIASPGYVGCTALRSVTVSGMYYVPSQTLMNCINLETVSLPTTLCTVGPSAFEGCTSLNNLTIPQSPFNMGLYNGIDSRAFAGCSQLSSIVIPLTFNRIAGDAFVGCPCPISSYRAGVTLTNCADPNQPTAVPTTMPSQLPTGAPTHTPTAAPTTPPTATPTAQPSMAPRATPSRSPTATPTAQPSMRSPTATPTAQPSMVLTAPTVLPPAQLTFPPTIGPTARPTTAPTMPDCRIVECGQHGQQLGLCERVCEEAACAFLCVTDCRTVGCGQFAAGIQCQGHCAANTTCTFACTPGTAPTGGNGGSGIVANQGGGSRDGLGTGAFAGIVVGAVVLLVGIGWSVRRRRSNGAGPPTGVSLTLDSSFVTSSQCPTTFANAVFIPGNEPAYALVLPVGAGGGGTKVNSTYEAEPKGNTHDSRFNSTYEQLSTAYEAAPELHGYEYSDTTRA